MRKGTQCNPELVQLHWQNRETKRTEFIAQRDVHGGADEIAAWIEVTAERFPLPEGHEWLVCNQGSPYFMLAAPE